MSSFTISGVSYSLTQPHVTLKDWEEKLVKEITVLMKNGSKVIIYPELFLLGLCDFFSGKLSEQLKMISDYTQETLLPRLAHEMDGHDILLCLGSGPRKKDNQFLNSSPIFKDGKWIFQDKIHLTPWETDFAAGNELHVFQFQSLKTAVVICYDIEQPLLAQKLKTEGIDLILVPSATMNQNGNQRVNRCASARSIELGACVVTVPLVGNSSCDLVDHNEGRQGFFLPAQEAATYSAQEQFSTYSNKEHVIHQFELDLEMMKKLKNADSETKPYFKQDQEFIIVK
jgi:predicted amidohydrolase